VLLRMEVEMDEESKTEDGKGELTKEESHDYVRRSLERGLDGNYKGNDWIRIISKPPLGC
jgi:hypothetical protein